MSSDQIWMLAILTIGALGFLVGWAVGFERADASGRREKSDG